MSSQRPQRELNPPAFLRPPIIPSSSAGSVWIGPHYGIERRRGLGSSPLSRFQCLRPSSLPLPTAHDDFSRRAQRPGRRRFPLIVTGTNFLPCSRVQWTDSSSNVTALPTTYVNPTQLSASVSAANLATVETVQRCGSESRPIGGANLSATIPFPDSRLFRPSRRSQHLAPCPIRRRNAVPTASR